MLSSHVRIISCIALFSIIASPYASSQTLNLINAGTDDRIQSVTGLDISGTTYDVTFHHGIAFASLTAPLEFTTQANAQTAYNAIEAYVNSTNTTHLTNFGEATGGIIVPFNTDVDAIFGSNDTFASPYSFGGSFLASDLDPANIESPETAYVTFSLASTTAVPEPTTFALAGTLSLGAVVLRRRRNQLSADSKTNP